jgi:hypothetical protein
VVDPGFDFDFILVWFGILLRFNLCSLGPVSFVFMLSSVLLQLWNVD